MNTTDLNENELAECKKVLRRTKDFIIEELQNPDVHVSERYHKLVVYLRTLLIGQLPVLIEYARSRNIPLIVWAPKGYSNQPQIIAGVCFSIASWTETHPDIMSKLYPLPVEEFLELVVYVQGPLRVTPRKVITWVANKEGSAHLDFKKPAAFLATKSLVQFVGEEKIDDESLVRRYIVQMSFWCVYAIDRVLE